MQYKGDFYFNNQFYTVKVYENTNSKRVDIYCEETVEVEVEDEYSTLGLDNETDEVNEMLMEFTSLFSPVVEDTQNVLKTSFYNSKGTEFIHGDYSLYNEYSNIENLIKFKLFSPNSIITDEPTFDAKGVGYKYHAEEMGYIYKYEKLSGDVISSFKQIGDNYISLKLSSVSNVIPPTNIKYKKRIVADDICDIIGVSNEIRSLAEIGTFKDLSWLSKKDYTIVNDIKEFNKIADFLNCYKGAIGFDTETSGLRFNRLPNNHPLRDHLTGLCISWQKDQAIYIPVAHTMFNNIDVDYTIRRLKPMLEHGYLVTHNGQFDARVMRCYEIFLNICEDTFALRKLLTNSHIRVRASLKALSEELFSIDQINLTDIFINKNRMAFQDLPYDIVRAYAPADADITLQSLFVLKPLLPRISQNIYALEIETMKNLAWDSEYYGARINTEILANKISKTTSDLQVLNEAVQSLAGYPINIDSPQQLSDLFYGKLGCPTIVRKKNNINEPSTDSRALNYLGGLSLEEESSIFKSPIISKYEVPPNSGDVYKDDKTNKCYKILVSHKKLNSVQYPIILIIKAYRELSKQLSTLTSIEKDIDNSFYEVTEFDNSHYIIDGLIFSEYKPLKAPTGRIISANMNFQQIPSDLKEFVIPSTPLRYFVNADYSQVELRIMASIAGDKPLMHEMEDPDNDIHRLIASRILGKPAYMITDKERKKMKKCNFGVPYDMGGKSLAELLYDYPITKQKIEDALRDKFNYLNNMPRVRDMFTSTRDTAQAKGYAKTIYGRIEYFPTLPTEQNESLIQADRRRAGNLPIQGTAADLFKFAFNRLEKWLRDRKIDAHVIGLIHDEFLIDTSVLVHPYVMVQALKECMEVTPPNFAPLFIGASIVDNWGEGKDGEYELPVVLADRMAMDARTGNLPKIEGSYKDYLYNEKINFIHDKIYNYITEIGFDWNKPFTVEDIEALVPKYINMFNSTEIKDICKGIYKKRKVKVSNNALTLTRSLCAFISRETDTEDLYEQTLEYLENNKASIEEQEVDFNIDTYLENNQEMLFDIHNIDINREEDNTEVILDKSGIKKNLLNNVENLTVDDFDGLNFFIFGNILCVDLTEVSKQGIIELNNYMQHESIEGGYYKVVLMKNHKMITTNYRFEVINRTMIDKILNTNRVCI